MAVEEYDYLRKPDDRTTRQVIKDWFYDPVNGTVFGHTKRRWGIVGLFYLVFYSVLALLCAICTMGLLATIDKQRPKYTLGSSIIGTNPGLGFRPIPKNFERGATILYSSSNATQILDWVTNIDKFLERYLNKTKLPNSGRNQVICDYDRPPKDGKVCAVDISTLGPCSNTNSYGFNNSSPCIFIKLNRIFDWMPEFYNDSSNLPEKMPTDLKNHIKSMDKSKLNTVWVSCNGETEHDNNNMGEIEYFPSFRGLPGYYYPFTNAAEYLSPVVAVHFKRPKRNEIINIECRAWAKNIVYSSHRGEKAGGVHFELKIVD